MNKCPWLVVMIYNIICIICWAALAIIFEKWWITLFAILFISTFKSIGTTIYCDECGKTGPSGNSSEEARKKAKEAGWMYYPVTNTDCCPDCMMKKLVQKGDTK